MSEIKKGNEIKNQGEAPEGELSTRTLAMPGDTNPNGDIFGGWVLSQMDIAGAISANNIAGRTVTVSMDGLSFIEPVSVGDVVCCYTKLVKTGRTSITLKVSTWTVRKMENTRRKVTEGIFTYVSIGEDRRPKPLPDEYQNLSESPDK